MNKAFYPLSEAQYNIWLSEQYFKGSAVNVLHAALWFLQPFDSALLRRAVSAAAASCGVFGIHFSADGEQPVQRFLPPEPIDCAAEPAPYSEQALRAALCARAETAFDFEKGPLYDFRVYSLTDGLPVLSIKIHHILIDGFGMGLFCDLILQNCNEMLQGLTPAAAPNLFFPQAKHEESAQAEDKAFWADYLKELPPKPALFPQTAHALKMHCSRQRLSPALTARIAAFCFAEGVTPYTVFAATFALYLMRAAQATKALLLLPRLNRETEAERGCIGPFALAVPLLAETQENDSFAALCRRLQEAGRLVTKHKKYGYSRILSDLKGSGALRGSLCDYTLNFQKSRKTAPVPARLEFRAGGEMSNHITLNVSDWDESGGYELTYDCRAELCSEQRAGFLHASLLGLLEQGLRGAKPAAQFEVLSPEENALLREGLCGSRLPYPPEATIVSLFAAAVCANREKPALFACDQNHTFGALDSLSNRVANALLDMGVNSGAILAFLLPRDARLLPCILGILKTGAAFLPIDPQFPEGRIDYILQDSGAAFFISTTELAQGRAFLEIGLLLSHPNERAPRVNILQEQPAYCIYTSGTTGCPKGVLLRHRGIVNITRPENNPFNRDLCARGKGLVAIGSICFDISLFELFVPLLNGLFVVLAREEELANPVALAKLLQKHGANILHCTPSRLAAYLREPCFRKALHGVAMILSAGEVLPPALASTLKNGYGCSIYNGYGPTEATIGATITEAGDSLTIGRPIANANVLLLNTAKAAVPFGAPGELAVGGDGVGVGYLKNEALTAEKFISLFGERFYLTGDLGYWAPDGRLMYLGRGDQQVKLRGLRIELPEIENCLLLCEGITHCAVLVREIGAEPHLAAFYTAKNQLDAEALKRSLGQFLAVYMVPDIFVQLEEMPLTINGKTDLAALRAIPMRPERHYEAPASQEESLLCGVFEAVLQAGRVGVCDNFFEAGGTSLLAAKVLLLAKKEGISLSYADIFQYPTPRQLAEKWKAAAETTEVCEIAALAYERVLPVMRENKRFCSGGRRHLGNVLLTGATGYLGVHILRELIEGRNFVDKIICLVRPKGALSAEKRLKGVLYYYFETMYPRDFAQRVTVAEGDLAFPGIFSKPQGVKIDTIINSAANVAHFAYGDALLRVNTGGVKNLIHFAKAQNAAIVHISTISVGGYCTEQQLRSGIRLEESTLFVGQKIYNAYILSKYKAELLLLEAATEGLPVKLLRVGNLQGRLSDGEFQMNLNANAFTRQLRSYILLQKAPSYLLNTPVNISPVDDTAKAVVLLAQAEPRYTVFHASHPASVPFAQLAQAAAALGYPIEFTDSAKFEALVDALSKKGSRDVEGLLLERPDIHLRETPASFGFTLAALRSLNFSWGAITSGYLNRYFSALEGMGFFSK